MHVLEQGRKRELAIQAVKSGKTLQQFRIGHRVLPAMRRVECTLECFGVAHCACPVSASLARDKQQALSRAAHRAV